jgi:hypothetical protein
MDSWGIFFVSNGDTTNKIIVRYEKKIRHELRNPYIYFNAY